MPLQGRARMFTRDPKTAKIGVEILPLEVGSLPEFFKKKGEVELSYTQSVRESSLRKLKEVIKNDKTLSSLDCTDSALLIFLNSRKYDIDLTVLRLNKYIKFKKSNPEFFSNITFEALSPMTSSKLFSLLPWRCQDGCAIVIIHPGNYDPETMNPTDVKRMCATTIAQSLRDPMTQVNGFKIIYDLDMGLHSMRFCTPQNLYHVYLIAEKVLAGRVKGYHIVNMGVTGRTAFHVMKMFMSEKMQKRIFVHQSMDELLDFFPKAILPIKYGGDLKDYDMTELLKKMTTPKELAALNILSN